MDVRVLLFVTLASLVTGILAGGLPAVRASRTDLNDALKLALGLELGLLFGEDPPPLHPDRMIAATIAAPQADRRRIAPSSMWSGASRSRFPKAKYRVSILRWQDRAEAAVG